jgi:hypothetical protein
MDLPICRICINRYRYLPFRGLIGVYVEALVGHIVYGTENLCTPSRDQQIHCHPHTPPPFNVRRLITHPHWLSSLGSIESFLLRNKIYSLFLIVCR